MKKYLFFLIFLMGQIIVFAKEPAEWNISKSTHFIVYYNNATSDFVNLVMDRSEEYYNQIADDLGFNRFNFWLWDDRAKIYIYDSLREYQASTGQPAWSYGVAMPGKKTIYTFSDARDFVDSTLPHEIGHIIFREFVGFNNQAVTLWLEEGVASHQQKIKYSSANFELKQALTQGSFINLEKLSQTNYYLLNNERSVRLFYLEAYSVIDFLLKEFGRENFVSFCQNLRDQKDLRSAIALNYPFSTIKELDSAWQEYIKK